MATQKIAVWGNSLGVRIPQSIVQQVGLKAGSILSISAEGDKIVLSPTKPKYTLKELLKEATFDQQQQEVDWGRPQGDEFW